MVSGDSRVVPLVSGGSHRGRGKRGSSSRSAPLMGLGPRDRS